MMGSGFDIEAGFLRRRDWLGLAAAALVTRAGAATGTPVLLVVGDSLSAEYGLKRGTGWVPLLQQRLAQQKIGMQVVNASISGDTSAGGLSRLPPLLAQHRPAVVVLELGSNDALRGLPLSMTETNLAQLVDLSRQAGARVLLVGMQVPPNYGSDYAKRFADLFPNIARRHQAALAPFLLAGIADAPDPLAQFQADRLHPNEQAQPRMLDNVWPELKKLLPGATPPRASQPRGGKARASGAPAS
jgi:acyl-CoA thioesterase I